MSLEDEFGDVIRKARVGLRLSLETVAQRIGLSVAKLEQAEKYQFVPDEAKVEALAALLQLAPPALLDLARNRYEPTPTPFDQLGSAVMLRSHYGSGVVNCYAVWDSESHQGAFFDTGVDFQSLKQIVHQHEFEVRYLFLTHTHGDHVSELDRIRETWSPTVVCGAGEPLAGVVDRIERDTLFAFGKIRVRAFLTPGHSPGGSSFLVEGFGRELPALCICGDTLFAGSAGGALFSYDRLLDSVRRGLLGLAPSTILCPGHGPLSDVGQERLHNPFAGTNRS